MMMQAHADIQAGICGFRTSVSATAERNRLVSFAAETDCETVATLAAALTEHGAFDAFDEIDPRTEGSLMSVVRAHLKGCCAGCAVPVGLFKAMQVAAGLALPKDIEIGLSLDRSVSVPPNKS
jgi:sorbitol-specific phosphotransferase system component IIBC